ncbi:toxin-antitoxin system TumE family protein [Pseudomonas sp. S2_A05]
MDYAYMLYPAGASKEIYRDDSAPDHPDLPFFPDHEHERPSKKRGDRTKLPYGNPLLDLKPLQRLEKDLRFA